MISNTVALLFFCGGFFTAYLVRMIAVEYMLTHKEIKMKPFSEYSARYQKTEKKGKAKKKGEIVNVKNQQFQRKLEQGELEIDDILEDED